jgi:limonene-1,2-epoxide hydrolase
LSIILKILKMANNTSDAEKTVLSFIDAMNAEDFKTARNYVTDDMKFIGVLGTRDSADAYFKDMERMKLKYDIQKIFSDENDVCLFYDITMSGLKIFSCGWYKTENNKIKSFKVIFDPRPLLEQSAKD